MKNLLIFAHDSGFYGASQSLMTLIKGLKEKGGWNFFVVIPYKGPIEKFLETEEISYQIIDYPRCVKIKKERYSLLEWFNNYDYKEFDQKEKSILNKLDELISPFQPQLIYTNTSVVTIGYHYSKLKSIPHVWHIREFGDLDYGFKYLPSRKKIQQWMGNSSGVIFNSRSVRNHWLKNKNQNISVVYNGVLKKEGMNNIGREIHTIKNISILGAIVEGKGQHIAIEAFALIHHQFPDSTLNIYGGILNEEYDHMCRRIADQYEISEKVFFKGFIDSQKDIYETTDLLLNCSRMEAFGRTIVEAMAQKIPVIANSSGGVPEIIENEVNGLLFDKTPESLANTILKLKNTNKIQHLVDNGLKTAREKFTIDRYVDEMNSILNNSVKQGG